MDFEEIRQELVKELETDPENDYILCRLASATIETRDFEEGLNILQKAVQLKPSVQTLTNLGYFYLKEGEPTDEGWFLREDKAIQVLEWAINLNPLSHFTYSVLGEAYLKTNRNSDALNILFRAVLIEQTPANLNNLGVALFRNGDYAEAASRFYQSHYLSDQEDYSFYPYFNYGMTVSKLGKKEEVRAIAAYINDNKDLESLLGVSLIDLMELHYENQDYTNCIEIFERAKEHFYIGPAHLGLYLFSLNQTGKNAKVKEVYERAIEETRQSIEEIKEDDEIDPENKDWQVKSKLKDIQGYNDIYDYVLRGHRPPNTYEPYIESRCYMFGCLRHCNPTYSESVKV